MGKKTRNRKRSRNESSGADTHSIQSSMSEDGERLSLLANSTMVETRYQEWMARERSLAALRAARSKKATDNTNTKSKSKKTGKETNNIVDTPDSSKVANTSSQESDQVKENGANTECAMNDVDADTGTRLNDGTSLSNPERNMGGSEKSSKINNSPSVEPAVAQCLVEDVERLQLLSNATDQEMKYREYGAISIPRPSLPTGIMHPPSDNLHTEAEGKITEDRSINEPDTSASSKEMEVSAPKGRSSWETLPELRDYLNEDCMRLQWRLVGQEAETRSIEKLTHNHTPKSHQVAPSTVKMQSNGLEPRNGDVINENKIGKFEVNSAIEMIKYQAEEYGQIQRNYEAHSCETKYEEMKCINYENETYQNGYDTNRETDTGSEVLPERHPEETVIITSLENTSTQVNSERLTIEMNDSMGSVSEFDGKPCPEVLKSMAYECHTLQQLAAGSVSETRYQEWLANNLQMENTASETRTAVVPETWKDSPTTMLPSAEVEEPEKMSTANVQLKARNTENRVDTQSALGDVDKELPSTRSPGVINDPDIASYLQLEACRMQELVHGHRCEYDWQVRRASSYDKYQVPTIAIDHAEEENLSDQDILDTEGTGEKDNGKYVNEEIHNSACNSDPAFQVTDDVDRASPSTRDEMNNVLLESGEGNEDENGNIITEDIGQEPHSSDHPEMLECQPTGKESKTGIDVKGNSQINAQFTGAQGRDSVFKYLAEDASRLWQNKMSEFAECSYRVYEASVACQKGSTTDRDILLEPENTTDGNSNDTEEILVKKASVGSSTNAEVPIQRGTGLTLESLQGRKKMITEENAMITEENAMITEENAMINEENAMINEENKRARDTILVDGWSQTVESEVGTEKDAPDMERATRGMQTLMRFEECCKCNILTLPLDIQYINKLREEMSRRHLVEQLVKMVESEAADARKDLQEERLRNSKLEGTVVDIKVCKTYCHLLNTC